MSYTIILHRKNKEDMIKTGLDKLNAMIIAGELQLKFAKLFESGDMSVEILEEKGGLNYGK